jgi:hypothetical protein
MSREQKRREWVDRREAYRKQQGEKWHPQVVALLKSGWLGIGYTVHNQNNARKRMVTANATLEAQQELETWITERMAEGYVPILRYYVAKEPCEAKDADFPAP